MAGYYTSLWIVLTAYLVFGICADNETAHPAPDAAPPRESNKPSGAIASIGRMIVDVPLGIVEAFKDAAEAIESVVLAIVRGIF